MGGLRKVLLKLVRKWSMEHGVGSRKVGWRKSWLRFEDMKLTLYVLQICRLETKRFQSEWNATVLKKRIIVHFVWLRSRSWLMLLDLLLRTSTERSKSGLFKVLEKWRNEKRREEVNALSSSVQG
jgi:hypothetical protein